MMGLARVEFMKPDAVPTNECDSQEVFCNAWVLDSNLAEGADGTYKTYHVFKGMHPHDENWNWAEEDPVGDLINSIGNGVY